MKKRAIIIFTVVSVLISCTSKKSVTNSVSIEPILPLVSVPIQSPPTITNESIPAPKKTKTIDWQISLSPLVQKMFAVEGIHEGSVLLINTMKNTTDGNVKTDEATTMLNRLITDAGKKFQVVNPNRLNIARKMLGLSMKDSLELYSKAIGLARYLNAQYMLNSFADGDSKKPTLYLQLILVKSGEIIWSDKGVTCDY